MASRENGCTGFPGRFYRAPSRARMRAGCIALPQTGLSVSCRFVLLVSRSGAKDLVEAAVLGSEKQILAQTNKFHDGVNPEGGASGSPLRGYPHDECRERSELLLDQAARGLVLYLAGRVVQLGRAIADEDFRLVEREGVEKHHRLAQVVLHACAPERTRRGRLQRHRLAGKGLVAAARPSRWRSSASQEWRNYIPVCRRSRRRPPGWRRRAH